MIRKNILFLLLLLCSAVQAQTLMLSNCNTDSESQLEWVSKPSGVGFASRFTRFKMRAYKDCQMRSITVDLDGNCSGKVFVATNSALTTRIAEKSFSSFLGGWTEVVFDTPLTLDGKEVYIGYELTNTVTGVITYSAPLVSGTEYMNNGSGWQTVTGKCGRFYANLTGASLPKTDISLNEVSMPNLASSGEACKATAEIVNLGVDNVKSLEITYTINDVDNVKTVSGLNIAPRASKVITLPELVFANDGDYQVTVTVSKVNGEEDAAPIDNTGSTKQVVVRSNLPQRKVLMEIFSTERCTNCPEGHQLIEHTLGQKTNIIEIGHHAGFYTDQFTIPASTAYEWFYKTPEYSTSYAPAVMLDRTNMREAVGSMFAMSVPLFEPTAVRLNKAYEVASMEPGLAVINIAPAYNNDTRELSVTVSAEVVAQLSTYNKPALYVFLTEDNITSNRQEGFSGNYTHRHVARLCMSGVWGDMLSGGNISKTYTTTLDAGWNADNMSVVAFVANYDNSSNSKCKVMNAESTSIKNVASEISEVCESDDAVVEYISTCGVVSAKPHYGVNIVKERRANGTVKTFKYIYK